MACKCSICTLTDATMTDEQAAKVACTPVANITGHRQWLATQPIKVASVIAPKVVPMGRPAFTSMIRGCGECRQRGSRCAQCKHDSY